MSANDVVIFDKVFFSYNGTDVLENASFSIRRGDFVAIVGPNGGGKTTLLRLALGFLKPRKGSIRVLGRSPFDARPRVGYVPQHFAYDERFPVTVMDVVLMGRLGGGWRGGPYRGRDRRAAEKALEEAGLLDLKRRPFADLSGGQRQRVLLARALATEPELLLLDEPLAYVDPNAVGNLYRLFEQLSRRLTVVLVSHDVGFVSTLVRGILCDNRTVTIHPASHVSNELFSKLYGTDVHFVRHDRECGWGERPCRNS